MAVNLKVLQSYINKFELKELNVEQLQALFKENHFNANELETLYLAAVKVQPLFFKFIPRKKRSHAICLATIQQLPEFKILLPPEELHNYDILYSIVKQDGGYLASVPEPMRDFAMCRAALQNNPLAIKDIPPQLLELDEFREPLEECINAIKKYGLMLEFLPPSKRDLTICLLAAKQNFRAINFVPEELLGHEGFKGAIAEYQKCQSKAIKKDWHEIINRSQKTLKLSDYINAVNQSWHAINFVPEEYLSHDAFSNAIKQCHEAIKNDWTVIKRTHEKLLTYEVCLSAIKQNISAFPYVPKKFRDFNLCLTAAEDSFSGAIILEKISDYREATTLTAEEYRMVCATSIKSFLPNFEFIPFHSRDYELCCKALKKCPTEFLAHLADSSKDFNLTSEEYKNLLSIPSEINLNKNEEIDDKNKNNNHFKK